MKQTWVTPNWSWLVMSHLDRMAWQWAETLVEIRDLYWILGELPNRGADAIFPNMNLTGLYVQKHIIIYWHIFHSSGFHHICNIYCILDCRYSPQNIFNAKNFIPHKKPISLFNVAICTQGMQRTWWPEAGTIIVTGPYCIRWYKKDHLQN